MELFHFGFGLGVKVPYGTTLLCYVLVPNNTHIHIYAVQQNISSSYGLQNITAEKRGILVLSSCMNGSCESVYAAHWMIFLYLKNCDIYRNINDMVAGPTHSS